MVTNLFRLVRNERGSQAIEFVAILPLFTIVILIVWQFALAATAKVTAEAAAMDGARVAMVGGQQADVQHAVRNVASGYRVDLVSVNDDGTYVTVTVTLQVPLVNSTRVFDTTGLSLPVSADVTVRKEEETP